MINLTYKFGIAVATIDKQDSSANILDVDFFEDLNAVLNLVESRIITEQDIKGLIFTTAKDKIFLAGADLISMQSNLNNSEWLKGVINTGQRAFDRIERLGIPTVAAIHGACLGGGLELALACDYRVASSENCTKIGLPEVMLGILPAWGGTTRLPRLIGLAKALKIILSGAAKPAKYMEKLGVVDKVCYKSNLLKEARKIFEKPPNRRLPNRFLEVLARPIILFFSKRAISKTTRGNYPAPLKVLEIVEKAAFSNKEVSLNLEREAFLELAKTKVCKNLIKLFFLQEKAKKGKYPSEQEVKDNIVVVGAGTMGAGIAQWILSRGKRVLLKDISPEAIAAGLNKIGKLFISATLGHKMDRPTVRGCLGRLASTTDRVPLDNSDLAIEVVVENFDLKVKVLKELESELSSSAVLATNTSALSITELGEHLERPENFVGIHFFNPVHKMKLVEIVIGEKTSLETRHRAIKFVQSIGKLPVIVKDSPGFLVNRILLPYLVEAIRLFSEGNSIKDIDNTMLKFGMPMGPLRLLDEIGLDVGAHVALDLEERLEGFKVPKMLHDILKEKQYGKKTGAGFYIYKNGKSAGENREFYKLQKNKNKLPTEELEKRMVKSMTDEAMKVMDEKISTGPKDIDFAMVLGTGWAPFRGGPLNYNKQCNKDI